MFTTPENVLKSTGKTVTADQVYKAQFVIEIWIGRTEKEVKKYRDREMLEKATIAQVVYMGDNYEQTYEQIATAMYTSNGTAITYKSGDDSAPWVAPLAVLACYRLSWRMSRSVNVGRTFQRPGRSFREEWFTS